MELYPLRVFLTVATEKSFSRAAEKLFRTQPAVSLALQRLENDLNERLIDRSAKELSLTDAGRTVLDYARRFENLQAELNNSLTELRDNSAGRLTIGANESTTLYLLQHIERYRRKYPNVKVQVRRSLSSKIPNEILDGNLELGVISYNPHDDRLISKVIYTDALAFIVSPQHRLADRTEISIRDLGSETFIAHNVLSPYREVVLREFQRHQVPLNMDIEMPTVETIRKLVVANLGVAFLPRMCVEAELGQGQLRAIQVKEIAVERKIHLLKPSRRGLSYAAGAFLELLG
ncbi:MAG: LysR substrate-binding domain-containing protein [Acidobacteriota bacterium]|nr:LysR substrate-binding domain-containing protein [Acidobacteriota bacterium]